MYCSKLLSRAKEKLQKQLYGSSKDGLEKLIQFGEKINQEGGKFKLFHTGSLVINGIAMQTNDMAKIHEEYGDYINLKYLNRIHEIRHKVFKWDTGKHFTAGGT